jgi:hypothetical protein
MLFKVEVTDANLYRNWRGYTVKKLSDEETIITRFTELHGINVSSMFFLSSLCLFFLISKKNKTMSYVKLILIVKSQFGCSSEYALDGAGADGADAADYAPLVSSVFI